VGKTSKILFCQLGESVRQRQPRHGGVHWERIEARADVIICANEYVKSIQPDETQESRYEQGVMVSMVWRRKLVPEQVAPEK
jgi:hypothetical protein